MPLCTCNEGPRCQMYNGNRCGRERASWTVLVPAAWKLPLRLTAKFACESCWQYFCEMWDKPIKGLTRPENAPDDWRPSLMDVIRHGEIAVAFEDQLRRDREGVSTEPPSFQRLGDERFTPAQLQQVIFLRSYNRQQRHS